MGMGIILSCVLGLDGFGFGSVIMVLVRTY